MSERTDNRKSAYPTIEHYGCIVDLLAQVGLVKEAEILIKSMRMEADGSIWGSLLNGDVHKFLVNDKSHFHLRGIYKVLNLWRKELEGFSVAPHHL